jgi:hypothetical protein
MFVRLMSAPTPRPLDQLSSCPASGNRSGARELV